MYEQWFPAFLGGLGGLIIVIVGQLLSHYLERKREFGKIKKLSGLNTENHLNNIKMVKPVEIHVVKSFRDNPPKAYVWMEE